MWKYFFDFLVKMRERGLVRWALKFLKIDEAPPSVRYSIIYPLVLLPLMTILGVGIIVKLF